MKTACTHMNTVCVMMLALVGGIQAYWPGNGHQMTNHHSNVGNHGIYGNTGFYPNHGSNGHVNYASNGINGNHAISGQVNHASNGINGNHAISGHVNYASNGINGNHAISGQVNHASSGVQSGQGTASNTVNPSEIMSILLMTKGNAALNDPMFKSLAMMSIIGGEGAGLTPQQLLQLTGTQMPTGQASNPDSVAALAAAAGLIPGASLSPAVAAAAALAPGAGLSPVALLSSAGAAVPASGEAPEGGAASRIVDMFLLSRLMPGLTA